MNATYRYYISVLLVLIFYPGISYGGEEIILSPEVISNLEGRYLDDSDSLENQIYQNKHTVSLWEFGETAADQSISWNIGDFSGFYPQSTTNFQRGVDDNWYGSTAVQLGGATVAGFQLYTWSSKIGLSSIKSGFLNYQWKTGAWKKPFVTKNSRLAVSFSNQIPTVYKENSQIILYHQSVIVLRSPNDKYIWITVQNYRDNGSFQNGIDWDKATNMAMILSNMNNTQFTSPLQYSSGNQNFAWSGWRWFGWSMNRQQLSNAILQLNKKYSLNLSPDVSQYELTYVGAGPEMYVPVGNAHMGASVKELWVRRLY